MKRVALTGDKESNARVRSKSGGNYFSSPKTNTEFIGSGCTTLDLALGGGWVERRVVNIVGDKSTGKTLLCTEAAANFAMKYAKSKGKIRYRESEAAFDQEYASALGMPVDRIDFGDPMETVEDLFEDLLAVIKGAKGPELYVCDSLDALSDRAEMGRKMDEGTYGAAKAKQLSQLFRRLVRDLEQKQITVIIVSQIRDKIGAMFGRKVTRAGGRALDFYASQVVYLAHIGRLVRTVRGQKRATGIRVKAMVDKNKVALPFREAEFVIRFGYGIDDGAACVEFLKSINALKDINVSDAKTKQYIQDLEEMPMPDFLDAMKSLRRVCTEHWYQIEKSLIPTRTKYGV